VAFALYADRSDFGFNDQFLYHHMAQALARGDGYQLFGEPTLRWPPAYPFLVSLAYRATTADATVALLLNALLSAAAIPLVHWCARPEVSRRAALTAAAVVAVLPGQWLFAGTILTEPLAAVQILLVLGLVVRYEPGPAVVVVLGFLIGTAALTRGEGALLGLVVVVGWWSRLPWRRVVVPVGAVALVSLVVMAPWVVRNSAVAGRPTGLSLNAAETLYSGHNPEADGGATYATTEVLLPAAGSEPGAAREVANAELLQDLALTWAREHPAEELSLVPKRLLHLLEGDGNVVSIWLEGAKDPLLGAARAPLEVLADVTWYALLAAFTVTLVVRHRDLRAPWVRAALVLPALSLVLYGVVLYGNFRYRIPYEPLLVLVTCAGWWPAGRVSATG
jgi:4-amino-4-deoxy-L-arabinose transferase-like glycosyltransferase